MSELEVFARGPYGDRFPPIVAMWQKHWEHIQHIRPVFAYPPALRRLLYTTNAIESLHMQLRKIIESRDHFPNDEAAAKLLYLALRNVMAKWKAAPHDWRPAMRHFAVLFGERFTTDS